MTPILRFPSLLFALSALALPASGQTLINNNFSTVTPDSYAASTGEPFGVANALGNATFEDNPEVVSTGGVSNSAYLALTNTMGMRSRNTANTTTTTTFSFNFLATQTDDNNDRGALGAGWNINPDNSDLHNASPAERDNRLLIGMRYVDGATIADDFFQLGYMTEFNGSQITDFSAAPGDTVTFDAPDTETWYSMSFDLTFNDLSKEWTVANLSVLNGSSTEVATLASATFANPSASLNTTTTANAVLAGWGDKNGINGFDNVDVTAVPEPTTGLLLLGGLGTLLVSARRRR